MDDALHVVVRISVKIRDPNKNIFEQERFLKRAITKPSAN